MSHVVREFRLAPGFNNFAFSAEHQIVGVHRDQPTGAIFITVVENTEVSDTEEGLVYRNVYVGFVGENLPFNPTNVVWVGLIPETPVYRGHAVFILPGAPVQH